LAKTSIRRSRSVSIARSSAWILRSSLAFLNFASSSGELSAVVLDRGIERLQRELMPRRGVQTQQLGSAVHQPQRGIDGGRWSTAGTGSSTFGTAAGRVVVRAARRSWGAGGRGRGRGGRGFGRSSRCRCGAWRSPHGPRMPPAARCSHTLRSGVATPQGISDSWCSHTMSLLHCRV
jgi:hypothetical protein